MCRSKIKIDSNQDKVETQLKGLDTKEHDKIVSRITSRTHEIQITPVGGGLVPKNPFASLAQAGYMHSHPSILGKEGLAEWDASSKGRKVPYKVKKAK
jgi:hypothetical protein